MQRLHLPLALFVCFLISLRTTAQTPPSAVPEQFYAEWTSLKLDKMRVNFQTLDTMDELQVIARFKVLKKTDEGGIVYEQHLGRVQQFAMGKLNNPYLTKLEGAVLRVTVSKDGKIDAVEGLEPIARSLSGQDNGLLFDNSLRDLDLIARHLALSILMPTPTPKLSDGARWTWRQGRLGSGFVALDQNFTVTGRATVEGRAAVKASVQGEFTVLPYDPGNAQQPKDMKLHQQGLSGNVVLDERTGRVIGHKLRGLLELTSQAVLPMGFADSWSEVQWEETLRVTTANPLESKPPDAAVTLSNFAKDERPKVAANSLGMKLALIPPGKFRMGAPVSQLGRTEYETEHDVVITRPFYMGAHEVTIGQYRQFAEATGYRTSAEKNGVGSFGWNKAADKLEMLPQFTWKNRGWEVTDAHPATNLSWYDARAFCAWLSAKEGHHYRLPTEAEWEYACRAGTTTRYHGGEEPECLLKIGNVVDESARKKFPQWQAVNGNDGFTFSAPVGSFQSNAFGLYDMHGNALEWCEDWFWRFPASGVAVDPTGPPFGSTKIQRGGSWADFPYQSTSARRTSFDPARYSLASGFRVVIGHEPVTPFKDVSWVGQRVIPTIMNLPTAIAGSAPPLPTVNKPPATFLVVDERYTVLKTQLQGKEMMLRKTDMVPVRQAVAYFTEKVKANPNDSDSLFFRASARLVQGDAAAGWADLHEALRLKPAESGMLWRRAAEYAAKKEYQSAIADYLRAIEAEPRVAGTHNELAWLLATCPDAKVRDGAKALEYARQAQAIVFVREPPLLESFAAAHAEAGDFKAAVECQEEAVSYAGYLEAIGDGPRERLELYRKKQPYRQP